MVKTSLAIMRIFMLVSAVFLITCGTLPTDPALDPKNVDAKFFTKGKTSDIIQDKQIDLGIIITYPHLT